MTRLRSAVAAVPKWQNHLLCQLTQTTECRLVRQT